MPIAAVVVVGTAPRGPEWCRGPQAAPLQALAERLPVGLVLPGGVAAPVADPPFRFGLGGAPLGLDADDPHLFTVAAAAAGCWVQDLLVIVEPGAADAAVAEAAGCPTRVATEARTVVQAIRTHDEEEAGQRALIGLGPHPEPWPADPRLDPWLLAHGDRRNVIDRFRYWREDAIVAELDRARHPFHVAVENWRHDLNIGTVVRNANAFGAGGVHVVGRRRWNRRGAMATDRYQHLHHHPEVHDLARWTRRAGLTVIGVDNVAGSVPLDPAALPERCLLLFGQEGPGLSSEALAASAQVVEIPQFGSTRSVNAGVASGIVMAAWTQAHASR